MICRYLALTELTQLKTWQLPTASSSISSSVSSECLVSFVTGDQSYPPEPSQVLVREKDDLNSLYGSDGHCTREVEATLAISIDIPGKKIKFHTREGRYKALESLGWILH